MARKILDTVHDTAKGLHKAGVMDTKTMHEFDALCLTPVKKLSAVQLYRSNDCAHETKPVRRCSPLT